MEFPGVNQKQCEISRGDKKIGISRGLGFVLKFHLRGVTQFCGVYRGVKLCFIWNFQG